MAVDFNAGNNECGFFGGEEMPGFGGKFGEVDDEKVPGEAEDAGYDAFYLWSRLVPLERIKGACNY